MSSCVNHPPISLGRCVREKLASSSSTLRVSSNYVFKSPSSMSPLLQFFKHSLFTHFPHLLFTWLFGFSTPHSTFRKTDGIFQICTRMWISQFATTISFQPIKHNTSWLLVLLLIPESVLCGLKTPNAKFNMLWFAPQFVVVVDDKCEWDVNQRYHWYWLIELENRGRVVTKRIQEASAVRLPVPWGRHEVCPCKVSSRNRASRNTRREEAHHLVEQAGKSHGCSAHTHPSSSQALEAVSHTYLIPPSAVGSQQSQSLQS